MNLKEFGLAVGASALGFVAAALVGEYFADKVGKLSDAVGFDL